MVTDMTAESQARILVVDDEQMLLDMVADALTFAGYAITVAGDGITALNAVRSERPDLVILDVNMPEPDGFQVARSLRATYPELPVLFLTARSDIEDLRTGFESGGDDYLTKPFRLEELRLRVAALLRRSGSVERTDVLSCGDLTMNDREHLVMRDGDEIQLSPIEYRLLHYLLSNTGQVLERAQILEAVWGFEYGDSVLETAISQLRKKVDAGRPKLIHTVRGFGYSIRPPSP
ncbi:MAG: response regulator transcription factor [Acidimicrobiia bacterium]|nr:response regulator transcription factor [Acidimicrobiia bacterium]NNF88921.1 response regulator transcription factor [Acidimicrobiia bacterium]NNJ46773.1 response regulator transcription factor [Acidimicrobiia bacterium]